MAVSTTIIALGQLNLGPIYIYIYIYTYIYIYIYISRKMAGTQFCSGFYIPLDSSVQEFVSELQYYILIYPMKFKLETKFILLYNIFPSCYSNCLHSFDIL